MEIQFATSERNRAFDYIKQVYPTKEIKEEQVSKLLDLVGQDVVRVQDPFMYGSRIAVVGGKNYQQASHKKLIDEAIQQLKDNGIL